MAETEKEKAQPEKAKAQTAKAATATAGTDASQEQLVPREALASGATNPKGGGNP